MWLSFQTNGNKQRHILNSLKFGLPMCNFLLIQDFRFQSAMFIFPIKTWRKIKIANKLNKKSRQICPWGLSCAFFISTWSSNKCQRMLKLAFEVRNSWRRQKVQKIFFGLVYSNISLKSNPWNVFQFDKNISIWKKNLRGLVS